MSLRSLDAGPSTPRPTGTPIVGIATDAYGAWVATLRGEPPGTLDPAEVDANYVRRSDNDNISSSHALDWATFILGLPTGISIDTNDSAYYLTPRRAFFFQDDWRLTSKLRVSLGLRFEHEGGSSERYNRGIVGSFFPDIASTAFESAPTL